MMKYLSALAALLMAVGIAGAAATDELPHVTAWIGNSFGTPAQSIQQDIAGLYVAPDGTVYTNTTWDECTKEIAAYKGGYLQTCGGLAHDPGYAAGISITGNAKYIYFDQFVSHGSAEADSFPPAGHYWFGVGRRPVGDLHATAPFASGKGGAHNSVSKSFLLINEIPFGPQTNVVAPHLAGLAATDQLLFVSNPAQSQILVFDAETMEPVRKWNCYRPGRIALDQHGDLWIAGDSPTQVSEGGLTAVGPAGITRCSSTGELRPQKIVLPDGVVPTAIAFDHDSHLLVADNGPSQQILVYGDLDNQPTLQRTIGEKGGAWAGPDVGLLTPNRLTGPTGIGVDAAGLIYVSSNGQGPRGLTYNWNDAGHGARLACFKPDGSPLWSVNGLEFVDVADPDPADDTVVYTSRHRYKLDYTRPLGDAILSTSVTYDPWKYPLDFRLQAANTGRGLPWMRRVDGHLLMYTSEMYSSYLAIFRFDASNDAGHTGNPIAVPSGIITKECLTGRWFTIPNEPTDPTEYIWRDRDGSGQFHAGEFEHPDTPAVTSGSQGWFVDATGGVWLATPQEGGRIRRWPMQGFDDHGNPIYNYASLTRTPLPEPFICVKRIDYEAAGDTMYLSGFTTDQPLPGKGDGGQDFGPVLARYDHWLAGNRQATWTLSLRDLAVKPARNAPRLAGLSIAGDYLFTADTDGRTVRVFTAATGKPVGVMHPGPEVAGKAGWVDVPYGIRAHQRADGEFLIFVEEDFCAKVLMYRLPRIPAGQE